MISNDNNLYIISFSHHINNSVIGDVICQALHYNSVMITFRVIGDSICQSTAITFILLVGESSGILSVNTTTTYAKVCKQHLDHIVIITQSRSSFLKAFFIVGLTVM